MAPYNVENVLEEVIGKITYREYYDKMKVNRQLDDAVIPFVISKYITTTIGVLTCTGMWISTGCNDISKCELLFAYHGKGKFLPLE